MADTACLLAGLRATGYADRPLDGSALATLRAAAARAGRRLVDLPGGQVTLGWLEGSEPAAGSDTGVVRVAPSTWLVLTFTAALRACWTDKEAHPFPGGAATQDVVLAALATLGTLSGTGNDGAMGAAWQQKGALPHLRRAGLLGADESCIRLGPRVAVWSEREVQTLRHVYDLMPFASRAEGGNG